MKVSFKLLGQPCNPVNRSEITLEINHDQGAIIDQPKPHVGINNLYFSREDVLKVMNYLTNTPGSITEGAPFEIEITEKNQTEKIDMYLNLMDGFMRSKDGIEASVVMRESLDALEDRIEGFTFESMYNDTSSGTVIIDSVTYSSYQDFFDKRCIFIPYVISTIPNAQAAFMAIASIIALCIQWFQTLMHIVQQTAYSVGVLTTIPGIIALAAEIGFFIFLTAALVALINQLIASLIQHIKYHGAMLLIDMLKVVSHKVGFDFQSSIWNSDPFNRIAYLPEKYNPQEDAPNTFNIFGINLNGYQKTGFDSPGYASLGIHDSSTPSIQKGYFNGTGADFMRFVKKICNGKIITPDQTSDLILERRDYNLATSSFQLKNIRQDWNGFNTDELTANIVLRFADDLNDKNCIDKYMGTIFQATHEQASTVNKSLVCLKGLREIKIEAARGINKTKLTIVEKLVNSISFLLSQQNYNNRFNCLLLENDMVTVPKLLLVNINGAEFTGSGGYSGQKRIAYLDPNNQNIINAEYLWNRFYYIDAFVGSINNRQTKISPANNHPSDSNQILLSLVDFKSLVFNTKFKDNFGEDVLQESTQWRIGDETGAATMKFRKAGWLVDPQNKDGMKRAQEININLQLKKSIPNGQ